LAEKKFDGVNCQRFPFNFVWYGVIIEIETWVNIVGDRARDRERYINIHTAEKEG
jgi:hypothetical protein